MKEGIFILLVECSNVKKYFGQRLIIDIKRLSLYSEDRIGIVGANGVGKTTLLKLLSKQMEPDEGWVKLYGTFSFMSQLEPPEQRIIKQELAAKFKVPEVYREELSGGEKTRFKLAVCLGQDSAMIFADEPTSNLDMEGITLIERYFAEYPGALFLVSHDRYLLDRLCTKILEIEDGQIKIYPGNYSDYKEQKVLERARVEFEYEQYIKEKRRLERVKLELKEKTRTMRKTPKRMGNSEARLHKMGNQKAKANLDKTRKSVESRIQHLEPKEKPKKLERVKFDIKTEQQAWSRILVEGKDLNKAYGSKVIFRDSELQIEKAAKIALIGPNGCGKSTLLKMIIKGDSVRIAPSARIGYFAQDLQGLKENASILENVLEESIFDENFVRILLARLLFRGEAVNKKVSVLSGGERVKVALAKIICQDYNLLLLDEPTNYLDINSLEVIEEALQNYKGALLFVSHDRSLIRSVANQILTIEGNRLKLFRGTYEEYLAQQNRDVNKEKEDLEQEVFILQNRLAEVISRISLATPKDNVEELDMEYKAILTQLKRLKEQLESYKQ